MSSSGATTRTVAKYTRAILTSYRCIYYSLIFPVSGEPIPSFIGRDRPILGSPDVLAAGLITVQHEAIVHLKAIRHLREHAIVAICEVFRSLPTEGQGVLFLVKESINTVS